MSIFVIGDTHLSLSPAVDKPMDVFGEAWKDHHEKIKRSWLEQVSAGDTVVIPGDISWGLRLDEALPDLEWLHDLPGKKVVLKGNHDLWWSGIGKLNSLFDDMFFLQNTCYDAGAAIIAGTRGWVCPGSDDFSEADRKIYDREVLRLGFSLEMARSTAEPSDTGGVKGEKETEKTQEIKAEEIIGFMHFPPTNDKKQPSDFTELFEKYGVKKVYYGHLHRKETFKRGITGNLNGVEYRLVSADRLGFELLKIR